MSAFKGSLQLNQDDAAWRFTQTPDFSLTGLLFSLQRFVMAMQQKTYWHLPTASADPNLIMNSVTSKSLCYPAYGFTVKRFETRRAACTTGYNDSSRIASHLHFRENFRDPRETLLHKVHRTSNIQGLFRRRHSRRDRSQRYSDARFHLEWLHVLSRVVTPLRYRGNGLQWWLPISDYVSSGRIGPHGHLSKRGRNATRATELPTVSGRFSTCTYSAKTASALAYRSALQPLRLAMKNFSLLRLGGIVRRAETRAQPLLDEVVMNYLRDLALLEVDHLLRPGLFILSTKTASGIARMEPALTAWYRGHSQNIGTIQLDEKWHPLAAGPCKNLLHYL